MKLLLENEESWIYLLSSSGHIWTAACVTEPSYTSSLQYMVINVIDATVWVNRGVRWEELLTQMSYRRASWSRKRPAFSLQASLGMGRRGGRRVAENSRQRKQYMDKVETEICARETSCPIWNQWNAKCSSFNTNWSPTVRQERSRRILIIRAYDKNGRVLARVSGDPMTLEKHNGKVVLPQNTSNSRSGAEMHDGTSYISM